MSCSALAQPCAHLLIYFNTRTQQFLPCPTLSPFLRPESPINTPAMAGYKRHKRAKVSFFKNAKTPIIQDTSFNVGTTTNVYLSGDSISDPLKKLFDHVATNAILNAGGRADEGLVEHWMAGKNGAAANMLWLSGPAGAGKSAIVQTIAERCKERGVPAANFFFFRADLTRSSARPLVATLLYQILKIYPPARQAVASALSNDPLLFDASIQDQFNQLLATSAQDIPQAPESPARRPVVLLIDGLDECDSKSKTPQRQILQALDILVMQNNSPFLVLVASRAEPQISVAFEELSSTVQSIFLDDQYQPEKDIRVFVTNELLRIKKSHRLAHSLGNDWPSDGEIESIVKKSSGQFIFAATVMRYLANPYTSPKLSLQRVQGIAPIATNSPFAHLDAVYKYILSQADDREAVMDLLSAKLLSDSIKDDHYMPSLKTMLRSYDSRYSPELLDSCVSDLTSILKLDTNNLFFFHASFPDFLRDKSRAGVYYIDLTAFSAKMLPPIWTRARESMSGE
ncbi:hypothetical protein D9619_009230 [Psilocybe cf. subviscida]|uniref:NACHT domain-containing protein n=1 Tax=Psilocybe cf. subviscida TaxID=2480587 RepID=A0A8H5FAA3_9AGAR|nr:hypothetical protein D9619_009230 [Psilocybe cf. subviscida]